MPLSPANDLTLTALASKAGSEVSSLTQRPVDKMRQSIRVTGDLRAALKAGDGVAAEKAYQEAMNAWPANEVAKRLKPQVDEVRKTTAANAVAETKAKAAADAETKAAETKAKKKTEEAKAAQAASVEEPKKPESESWLAKPIFWVALILLGFFAAMGYKAYQKFRDPSKNLLDQ